MDGGIRASVPADRHEVLVFPRLDPGKHRLRVVYGGNDIVDRAWPPDASWCAGPGSLPSVDAPDGTAPRRSTRQRRAVLAELTSSSDFRSAQEIHDALRKRGDKVGLATIYLTLQSLVDGGSVDAVTQRGRRSIGDAATTGTTTTWCADMRRTVEVTRPAVERWATSVAEEHGYRDVDHIVEFIGTCPECAARR